MNSLLKNVKVSVVLGAVSAGQTAQTTSVLDMTGWDGVMFIAMLGDVTATSVLTLTAKGNSANSISSPTPVTQGATASFTAGAEDADSKALVVDVSNPMLRYAFAELTRTVANAIVGGIIAIQYNAALKPTTQDATVIASTVVQGVAA